MSSRTGLSNESFTYDNLNRLSNGGQFAYDGQGNIQLKDGNSYSYTHTNHSHAVSAIRSTAGNGFDYFYDANGNMVDSYSVAANVRGGIDRSFVWTQFNKVQQITSSNGSTTYSYDADHQRLTKTIAGGTTKLYIGKLYEKSTNGAATYRKAYIYAGGQLVAVQEQVDQLAKTMHYAHIDALGSIVAMSNDQATLESQRSYDAFGTQLGLIGGTDRGYTGHEQSYDLLDGEYGLINMNARLYDPVLGRFISADSCIDDPFNMQSFDRYHYALNNPLKYSDPSGYAAAEINSISNPIIIRKSPQSSSPIPLSSSGGSGPTMNDVNDFVKWAGKGIKSWFGGGGGGSSAPAPAPVYSPQQTTYTNSALSYLSTSNINAGIGMAVEFNPIGGAASSVYELATGRNYFTGEGITPMIALTGMIPGVRTIRRIDKLAGITFEGTVHRAIKPKYVGKAWDIHAANIGASHRYSDVGRGAFYAGTSERAVIGELKHYGYDPGNMAWVSKNVKVENVLDLTNPKVRQQLGVSYGELTGDSYFMTHALGDFARTRYSGLLVPSARAPGTSHLIIFP